MLILNKIFEKFLGSLILIFPICIILGPFTLNLFSFFFSLYALINFKIIINHEKINLKTIILYLSFVILLFPFTSIDFENSIFKYLSFLRFVITFFGIIIFLSLNNDKNNFLKKTYKIYLIYLALISIDVLKEYLTGTNFLGYSSNYEGRIASFTNDELIIGFIYSFLALFVLTHIYMKSNWFFFLLVVSMILSISFLIGERSNFLKLLFLAMMLVFFQFLIIKKTMKVFISTIIIIMLFTTFLGFTKNSSQAKKIYATFHSLIEFKNDEYNFNFKKEFNNTRHAPHYITAYKIFLDNPIFGIGINNFYLESSKKKYQIEDYSVSSTHPHQVYLEILSEVGITGMMYFCFIFFFPLFSSLKSYFHTKDIKLFSHIFLHIFFIFPLLPSGSIFGTNYGLPFWFNLSILFYISNQNDIKKKLKK